MAKKKGGLGKGLDALMQLNVVEDTDSMIIDDNSNENKPKILAGFTELSIEMVRPNEKQPRKEFDQESLENLAQSIDNLGLLQPISVVKINDYYEIIAGERRYRALKMLGKDKVPVIIKDVTQQEKLELALVENIQRENLNPIEEALAYRNLIELYNMTQEELSRTIGKSRAAITNSIRLLNLNEEIQKYITDSSLTSGHARAILSLNNVHERLKFAKHIIANGLSVRESEKQAKLWAAKKVKSNSKSKEIAKNIELTNAQKELEAYYQTRVNIIGSEKKGKIQIEYFSDEELERIIDILLE